jgi:mannosyl-oligosaccharide alpha-1,3-glucosidase
VLEWDEAGKAV